MIDIDLRYYFSLFLRRLPMFLIVCGTISTVAVAIAYVLPPVYRSQARILVESPQIPRELLDSTVNVSSGQILEHIKQRLMTRNNLLALSQQFDLFAETPSLSPSSRFDIVSQAIEFNVVSLGGGRGSAPTIVFTVSFDHESPVVAKNVANDLVTQILTQNLRIRGETAKNTTDFFEQEVARLSRELADIEGQIVSYKNENRDSLPDSLDFRRNEMSRIQARLMRMETEELTLKDRRAQLQRIIDDPSLASSTAGFGNTDEERELLSLRRQLAQKNAVFSDSHPQIVALNAEIKTLESLIQGTVSASPNSPAVASQTQTDVLKIDANLTYIKEQRTSLESQLAELEQSIIDTPNVEMSLNVLERNYASLQTQYSVMLERLNAATAGGLIESRQQGERFEVVEYPDIPENPDSPNRLLIAAAGIFMGIATGLGLIVLLEIFNPYIRRPVELRSKLGIQAFGTLPFVRTRRDIWRSRLHVVGNFVLFFGGTAAAFYAIHTQYMPIDTILSKLITQFGLDGLTRIFS